MIEIDVDIGKNLRVLMAEKNIRTIGELSEICKISRVTLSRCLKNESVSLTTLIRLCHGLDCELSDLVKMNKVS